MPPVKDIAIIQSRYEAASGMTDRYVQGVTTTKKSWQTNTLAGEPAYKTGVAEAAAKGMFGKGVRKVSNEDWRGKAEKLGGERYAGGITAGVPKYVTNVSPYLSVISGITLAPRGPRGSAANYERVKKIGEALHAKRVAGG